MLKEISKAMSVSEIERDYERFCTLIDCFGDRNPLVQEYYQSDLSLTREEEDRRIERSRDKDPGARPGLELEESEEKVFFEL